MVKNDRDEVVDTLRTLHGGMGCLRFTPHTGERYYAECTMAGGKTERFELTSREIDLLVFFSANPETVHSRDALLERFWGVSYGGTTRTLDQHIAKLRQKIERDCANPRHILTVHGIGYRFRP